MKFAVLQKDLNVPEVEKLARGLTRVPGFAAIDAHTFAKDGFGILVRNLDAERARALQVSLEQEEIQTDVVAEQDLPVLPQTKFVSRVDSIEAGLLIYDPLGRTFNLPWEHVFMVAAGSVTLGEFQTHRQVTRVIKDERGKTLNEYENRTKEIRTDRYLLEIIVSKAVLRYSIAADVALFRSLGTRVTRDDLQNFSMVLQDIFRFVPNAAVNRGAVFLKQGQPFAYPSKNAFYEEIVWLLWQLKKNQQ